MLSHVKKIKELNNKRDFTILIAESCTGGLISSTLTSINGSSKYFDGAVISYSNNLKNSLLKVPKSTINNYGAVSHQTALAMVKGLRNIRKCKILISVTGVAGPKGGTLKTPVGCVYFGIGRKIGSKYHFSTVKKLFREKSRKTIQAKSTEFILKRIIKEIEKL